MTDGFENIIQQRIDNFYSFNDDIDNRPFLNQIEDLAMAGDGVSFYDTFSLFHEEIHGSTFFKEYEKCFITIINEIQSRLIFLRRIKRVLFYVDKRTQFRRIVKFLFKNLDDEHSSVNNSIILKIKNYLLKKNLHEKGIYSCSC